MTDNVTSVQEVHTCYTSAVCMLTSPQLAVEGGQHNSPMVCKIGKDPPQIEEMPLDSPHDNLIAFSLQPHCHYGR